MNALQKQKRARLPLSNSSRIVQAWLYSLFWQGRDCFGSSIFVALETNNSILQTNSQTVRPPFQSSSPDKPRAIETD